MIWIWLGGIVVLGGIMLAELKDTRDEGGFASLSKDEQGTLLFFRFFLAVVLAGWIIAGLTYEP